jgi:hypothetical protein
VAASEQSLPSDQGEQSKGVLGGHALGLRLGLVALLALGLLSYVLLAAAGGADICREQLGQSGPAQVCGPASFTDPSILVPLILIVLLLVPDFSEIAIPGLVSLKRQVVAQERRQDALEQRLEFVVSQSTNQSNTQVVVLSPEAGAAYLTSLDEKALGLSWSSQVPGPQRADQVKAGAPVAPRGRRDPGTRRDDDAAKALFIQELLQRAETLRNAAQEAQGLRTRMLASTATSYGQSYVPSDRDAALMRWEALFSDELAYVFAARSAAAHAQPIDRKTLEEAVEIARKLQGLLPPMPE